MKNRAKLLTMLALTVILGGCSSFKPTGHTKQSTTTKISRSKTSEKTESKSVSSTTDSNENSSESQTNNTKTLWDADKSAALAKFMAHWSQTMKQQYQSYSPNNDTDFYGVHYPSELSGNDNMRPAVDNQATSMEWSADGSGSANYKVVAIYSDEETADYAAKHLYLFTIHQQQPVVLVTEQNQGNENNLLYFKETANTDLKNGFNNIFNNQDADVTSNSQDASSSTSETPKPYVLPANMQRNWYYVDDNGDTHTLKISDNKMTYHSPDSQDSVSEIYLTDGSDPDTTAIHSNWGRVSGPMFTAHDISFINIRGWNQSAGDGSYYGIKSEDVDGVNTDVLVEAGGASVLCDAVYYPTLTLATKMTTQKFDDIAYFD